MSPPIFSSFPTFDKSAASWSESAPEGKELVAQLGPSRLDKRSSSSSNQLRRSAKRRKREEREGPRYDQEDGYPNSQGDSRALGPGPRSDTSGLSSMPLRDRASPPADWPVSERYQQAATFSRSQLHFMDTVGDKEAQSYGTTSSRICPQYRRDEYGQVLGLPRQYRISKTLDKSSRGIEIAKSGQPYIPRYADRRRQEEEHLRFRSRLVAFDSAAAFVAVEENRREVSNVSTNEIEEFETQQTVDLARERIQDFENRLKSQPGDTNTWIAYSRAHVTGGKGDNHLAHLDISLSVLARALDVTPLADSVPLHLEYLRIAAEIWPSARVEHTWSTILDKVEQNIQGLSMGQGVFDLWLGHLNWSEGAGFGRDGRDVDYIVELYEQRLAMVPAYEAKQQVREERQLYLFKRTCTFLSRAGYKERAIAAFQAMLEISLSTCDDAVEPTSEFFGVLSDFGKFWDSGWPRMGEDDATGWRSARKQYRLASTSKSDSKTSTDVPDVDIYSKWSEAETRADQFSTPLRSHENYPDEIDPHQIVLFSDIQSLMFPIRAPESVQNLALAFLDLLGVDVSQPSTASGTPVKNDPHTAFVNQPDSIWPSPPATKARPWQVVAGEAMEPIRQSNLTRVTDSPIKCWSVNRNTLLDIEWFSDLNSQSMNSGDRGMIRNVAGVCRSRLTHPLFDLIYVATEHAASAKRAIKITKEMLAQEPDNVTLWAGYARLESKRGKLQSARSVYGAILANHTRTSTAQDSPALAMWADWARMEWTTGDPYRYIELLVSFADSRVPSRLLDKSYHPQKVSSLVMLKARQFYSTDQFPMNPSYLALATFFYYQESYEAAASLLQQNTLACAAGSLEREQSLQLSNEVHHRHSTWHPGPKIVVRRFLDQAMQEFPDNTQFLSTALWHHLQSGLRGPVHDLVHRLTQPDSHLQGMTWSLWAEGAAAIDLYAPGSGGASRVRATLRRALSSHVGRDCSLLWLQAIKFECLMSQPAAAKTLFYRAMGHVGTCKRLYLIPFQQTLRPSFTDAELIQIIEAMAVRGIRLRCDPVGFTASIDAVDVLPSDEELEDDELEFLRDRQANKPY